MSCALWAAELTLTPGTGPGGLSEAFIALLTLTLMEIVLGIDNVIFIALLAGKLPRPQQASARQIGLMVALGTRLLLLFTLAWIASLDKSAAFRLTDIGLPSYLFGDNLDMIEITWRDVVMLAGGLFLIYKSTVEIHHKLEGHDENPNGTKAVARFGMVIAQICVIDIVFSLDSVITAVGMAGQHLWVMITAMILAVGVMLVFAGMISDFVARHPTVKILALAFLILIGVMLVAEGFATHIPKGYIYFAMAFSFGVEMLNMRLRQQRDTTVRLHGPSMPKGEPAPAKT
ncbi:MAG: TerC family protein [Gemmataceae bacterium]